MAREVARVAELRCTLGEGPRWHAGEGALYLVDITEQRLHRLDVETGVVRTRRFDQPVGCFAFRASGGFVLAMADGFALIDDFDGPVRAFGDQVEAEKPWTRFNDGRTDPQGRFWAGTRDGGKLHKDAALYRLDPDSAVTRMLEGGLTANGLAVSPDSRTLYWTDTPTYRIDAFDFDASTGAVANRRPFASFPEGHGRPDGGSVDEDGCYWAALYAGRRVVRLSPAGEVLEEVSIPATNVTMPCFGGADRRTVFVTTAAEGEPDPQRFPQAGGVFSFRVETPGLPETPFAG